MEKNNRQLKKIVFKNIDLIYKSCNKTAKLWGSKTIPLNYLNMVINNLKDKTKKFPKELQEFGEAYKNMLNTFYTTCENFSKKYNSSEIPIKILYYFLQILKEEFEKGLNG